MKRAGELMFVHRNVSIKTVGLYPGRETLNAQKRIRKDRIIIALENMSIKRTLILVDGEVGYVCTRFLMDDY